MPYKTKEAAAAAKRKWRAANAEKDKAIRARERVKAREIWREQAKDPEFLKKEAKRLAKYDQTLLKKKNNLKRNYGISMAQYEQMLEKAGYCCEICGKHQRDLKRSLCVDHCHETGKVRGMLCHVCNVSLGQLGESNLQTAADYVKERG